MRSRIVAVFAGALLVAGLIAGPVTTPRAAAQVGPTFSVGLYGNPSVQTSLEGQGWLPDSSVSITSDNPATSPQVLPTDSYGSFGNFNSETSDFLVQRGDEVTVTQLDDPMLPATSRTRVVADIALTSVNLAPLNTVTGTAGPAETNVIVHMFKNWPECDPCVEVTRDVPVVNGSWTADFTGELEIDYGDGGWVSSAPDQEGNTTTLALQAAPSAPTFSVGLFGNPSFQTGLDGENWFPDSTVTVTSDNPSTSPLVLETSWYGTFGTYPTPAPFPVQRGDQVTVTQYPGEANEVSTTHVVADIDVTSVNLAPVNTVTGTAGPGESAVSVLLWKTSAGCDPGACIEATVDASVVNGTWTADFTDELDIEVGDFGWASSSPDQDGNRTSVFLQATSPPPMPATLTLVPDTELADNDPITLTGSGWPAGATLYVVECRLDTGLSGEACDPNTEQTYTVEPDGTLPAGSEYTVTQEISTGFGVVDCGLYLDSCGLAGFVWLDDVPGSGSGSPIALDFPNNNIVNFAGAVAGASISGTVKGDGGAVGPGFLAATCPGVTPVDVGCPGFQFSFVDPAGNFMFTNLTPGTWTIRGAQVFGGPPPEQVTPDVVLEVAAGNEVTCAFTLDTNKSASCTGASGATTVAEEAEPDATVSTPNAAVTTPNAGTVSISETSPTGAPPPNFVLVGNKYTISAPDATAADPLRFVFQVETTEPAESIAVFKDGTEVPACTDAQSSAAAPDPCVLSRVDDGDIVEITVLSSTASVWTFAVPDVVPFDFDGFYAPVNNPPVRNSVKAGRAIPVKFSLGGDQGLDIFADGYPKSHKIDCDTEDPIDEIESTVTAGNSTLTYDAGSGRYHYVWKTNSDWDGCRQLVLKLNDGTTHKANFDFK